MTEFSPILKCKYSSFQLTCENSFASKNIQWLPLKIIQGRHRIIIIWYIKKSLVDNVEAPSV